MAFPSGATTATVKCAGCGKHRRMTPQFFEKKLCYDCRLHGGAYYQHKTDVRNRKIVCAGCKLTRKTIIPVGDPNANLCKNCRPKGSAAKFSRVAESLGKVGNASRAAARESLPESLRATFDSLVEDYAGFAMLHYSRAWASYKILADLVRCGWVKGDI
jgi:hypothetical protein